MKKKETKKSNWIDLFKQFCKENKLSYSKIVPFVKPLNKKQEALNACAMLMEIVEIANKKDNKNKEWFPDWSSYSEYKWYPYFYPRSGSGFAFSATYSCYWSTYSVAGSRLCFKTETTAKKTAIKYLDIYEKFMTK